MMTSPLLNMNTKDSLGVTAFTRQGMAYAQTSHYQPQTTCQDDFRQAMTVAHKCVKVCGPATQEQMQRAAHAATWHSYLVKNMIGTGLASYTFYLQNYRDETVDQAGWEAAAISAGLQPITLDAAGGVSVSPGMQLFLVASTLFSLGFYETVGRPNGNPEAWMKRITS